MLRLENLTVRFGGHLALDRVGLHVRRGDCYGFLGHNGAGKTTTMRVALGLQFADAGRVIVDGFDAAAFPREARARMGGLIETPGFHGHMDGAANLALLARLQGFASAEARAEAERLLAAVGLTGAGTKPVANYSQGMRQRLGIAQALLGSPDVVLLDEPMSGLDPEGIEEVRRLLARLTREEGRTVLLSSHQLSEIAGLCNRIGILRQGRMLVEEETATLLAAEAGRYALATADDAAAAELLAAWGVEAKPEPAGGLEVALGARRPGDVARDLVNRGVELRTWAPRPPTLEEIYLRFAQGGGPGAAGRASAPAAESSAPAARRAPRAPVARVMRLELERWTSTPTVPGLLVLPALVAVASVWRTHAKTVADAADVASGRVISTSSVTAFEAFGVALSPALAVLAAVLAGLASQSIAGELARGTLRNVLLRPVRRTDAALGKAAALAAAALAAFALVGLAGYAASSLWFEWKDVEEILPNGAAMKLPGGEAEKMWPALLGVLAGMLPPLAAFTAVGLLAGGLVRGAAAGLALGLGAAAMLVVTGAADDSLAARFVETTRVMSNATEPGAAGNVAAPLACAAVAFALAVLSLRRRPIR